MEEETTSSFLFLAPGVVLPNRELVRCPLCSRFTSSTTYTSKALSINTFQSSGFSKANLTRILDLLDPVLAVFHSLYGTVLAAHLLLG